MVVEMGRAPGRGGRGGFGVWVLGGNGSVVSPCVTRNSVCREWDEDGRGGSFRRAVGRELGSRRGWKRGEDGCSVDVNVIVFLWIHE